MSKQDDPFLPEQVDEQIETLAHQEKNAALPETRLTSDLHQIYTEEHELAELVWARLNGRIMQNSQQPSQQKHQFVKEAQPMQKKDTQQPSTKNRWRVLEILAAVVVIVALVASMAVLFQWRQGSQSVLGSGRPTPSTTQVVPGTTTTAIPVTPTTPATPVTPTTPIPPTSVQLRVSAAGIPSTTQGKITIPSGTKVTLTVIPDHSLLPFQTFTMGIYATDPYGFSELQDCTYPKTDTCSYTIANSTSENTDYTKGTHTFRAFLGNIGGNILADSSDVTITWS